MYRAQMKNSACVSCVHLLNSHPEAPFYRYNLSVHRRAKNIAVLYWLHLDFCTKK